MKHTVKESPNKEVATFMSGVIHDIRVMQFLFYFEQMIFLQCKIIFLKKGYCEVYQANCLVPVPVLHQKMTGLGFTIPSL